MVISSVMQKKRRIPPAPLVDFDPVPRRYRQDGWTAERQRAFISALADTGSVKHAAARVGMSSEGAYYLRRQPGAEGFATAWLAALDHGIRQLEDIALERAIHGVERPVYSYGKVIGSRRVYNDRLLMFMLRNRAPDRFAPSVNRRPGVAWGEPGNETAAYTGSIEETERFLAIVRKHLGEDDESRPENPGESTASDPFEGPPARRSSE